ncbi:DUF2589 domain-containing protein [Brachyspira hampsonii]|uniref:DUF2589 domain-containing protein n=1 Tax=Brachyspira hampsonii TaxID=1287055 RepID=UPI001F497CE2|nr:DUF2589 domain-containing protein [Brachyspira hampsonii]
MFTKKKDYKKSNSNKKDDGLSSGLFPIMLKIGFPDENNKYGNKYYCVPYINLIPISQLNIDFVTASFDMGIIELIEPKKTNKANLNNISEDDVIDNLPNFETSSDMYVDVTGAGIDKDKGTTINVHISIRKTEISEGMSKLINEMTNLNQGFIEIKSKEKDIKTNE